MPSPRRSEAGPARPGRAASLLLFLAAASCAGPPALPPVAGPADVFIGNAREALARDRIAEDEPGRRTVLFENADHTVTLVQVNGVVKPHVHAAHDEIIHVLEGGGTFAVDGAAREVGPGDVIVIPRGAVHAFKNRGPEPTAALSIFTPRLDWSDHLPPPKRPAGAEAETGQTGLRAPQADADR